MIASNRRRRAILRSRRRGEDFGYPVIGPLTGFELWFAGQHFGPMRQAAAMLAKLYEHEQQLPADPPFQMPTGAELLARIFPEGLPKPGQHTELIGPSGAGKTYGKPAQDEWCTGCNTDHDPAECGYRPDPFEFFGNLTLTDDS